MQESKPITATLYRGAIVDDPTTKADASAEATTATESPPAKKKPAKSSPKAADTTKGSKTKEETVKILGDLAAAQKAVRDQASVASGQVYQVALTRITGNDNYRNEPSNLVRLGYKLVNTDDPEHSLLHMCLSPDIGTVRAAVALFEEHENTFSDDDDDNDAKRADRTTSIVSLSSKFDQVGQLQPVCVRPVGSGENRSLIFGQRRVAAAAYRHAKSRVQVEDGVEGIKVIPAVVKAMVAKVAPEQAWMMAVSENSDRKNDDPVQEGEVYRRIMEMVDPDTGKRYTLNKTASLMNVNKGRVRSYRALTLPRDEKKKTGLTDEDREAVSTGNKTVTWAIRKALNEQHYSDGNRQTNRAKPIPLKAMQTLFDDTAETNKERLLALAECMGFPGTDDGLAEAVKQSEKRIAEQEAKNPRGKRGGKPETDEPEEEPTEGGSEETVEDEAGVTEE